MIDQDARSASYDTDALLRDHRLPLRLVRRVRAVEPDPYGVTLRCETVAVARRMRDRYGTNLEIGEDVAVGPPATVRLDAVSPRVVRMRFTPGSEVPANRTPMLAVDPVPAVDCTVESTGTAVVLRTGALTVTVTLDPFQLDVRDARGAVLRRTVPAAVYQRPPTGESHLDGSALSDAWPWYFRDLAPLGWVEDPVTGRSQVFDTAFLRHDEHLFGFGERFGPLDKRGQAIHLWHANAAGTTWPLAYKNVPFHLSTAGYGIYLNSSYPITYHLGDLSTVHQSLHVQDRLLDMFLVAGPRFADILDQYVALTGRPQVPPLWSFGLWMSRMSYREQAEVEQVARRLRAQDVPCDVIHVDTDWFTTEWVNDLRFSPHRFPDPAGMVRTLRDLGLRVSLWQLPYISVRSRLYEQGRAHGYFARGADGEPHLIDGFFGPAAVIDFSNPDAARWYTSALLPLFDLGVAAIKTDFGEGAPVDAAYAEADGLAMHNLYPLLYNRAVFERTVERTGEPIIWGRSAYAGSQRYPVYWGGDPAARWEDLGAALSGGLSLALCGFPFWSQDIGGFAGTPSPQLYVRWAQAGLFMTHPRAHGSTPREPWAFGDRAVEIFRRYAQLRYRLLPYLYSEACQVAPAGQPVMRPLVLDWQDDPSTYAVADQFLLGREMMVAPVVTEDGRRRVYLPAGRWVRWSTGTSHDGPGWLVVEADLDELPMFLPAGALLPLADPVAHSGELRYEHLQLEVVAGRDREAELTLADGTARVFGVTGQADVLRVRLDPASRWTVRLHALPDPIRGVRVDGEPVRWRRDADRAVVVEAPAGSTTVEVTW